VLPGRAIKHGVVQMRGLSKAKAEELATFWSGYNACIYEEAD
jgi:hypothetical protein